LSRLMALPLTVMSLPETIFSVSPLSSDVPVSA
jgi:hypothetical protein